MVDPWYVVDHVILRNVQEIGLVHGFSLLYLFQFLAQDAFRLCWQSHFLWDVWCVRNYWLTADFDTACLRCVDWDPFLTITCPQLLVIFGLWKDPTFVESSRLISSENAWLTCCVKWPSKPPSGKHRLVQNIFLLGKLPQKWLTTSPNNLTPSINWRPLAIKP